MNRAEWLLERRKGIGASDVGAILGISPYQSPLGLYLEKRGELEFDQGSEETDFGHAFETAVLSEFVRRSGMSLWRSGEYFTTWKHPKFDFIRCTPDAVIESATVEDTVEAVVEAKTAMSFHRDAWDDGPPMWIEAQVQHQMMCTGAKKGYVPVYFDNRHFEIFEIERDQEMIDHLLKIELVFWQGVLDGDPPEVTSRDTTILGRWFPTSQEVALDLSELRSVIARAVELGPVIKSYEDELAYCKAQIMRALGEADTGLIDERPAVTWKEQGRTGIDQAALKEAEPEIYERFVKESRYRVMRFQWKGEAVG